MRRSDLLQSRTIWANEAPEQARPVRALVTLVVGQCSCHWRAVMPHLPRVRMPSTAHQKERAATPTTHGAGPPREPARSRRLSLTPVPLLEQPALCSVVCKGRNTSALPGTLAWLAWPGNGSWFQGHRGCRRKQSLGRG